ncbi:aldehyde dehydrogenase [Sediminicola luteus]|uniref:Aldehyde dehydrogenase n=1 Tax=Sediminicola luteus TaxID=319238 RepID=A0A2A4G8U7_9FLAO|nr:aldehyde dehydrogenase [Sediminicola luteus]PCE64192.1 aldehyde dehydrogenase [Sediminicola luteus]
MDQNIPNILFTQQAFFKSQITKDVNYRKEALKRLEKEILAQEDAVCEAIHADFKKPFFETLATETQLVLAELRATIKNIKGWARPKKVRATMVNFPSSDFIHYEPYGNVLVMAPWNYPFQLALLPLIGAVAAGNTVVLKPSEVTPHTSAIIRKIVEAVFAPEYVAVVEGGIPESQALLAERWDYIFFTGSTQVGKIVYQAAAKHLTPVTLELGGKNPCVVDETAPMDLTAKRLVWGKFLNGGQTCIAPDYILAHPSVKNDLVKGMAKYIEKSYGSEVQSSPDFCRMAGENHYQRLKAMLEGETILFGGQTDDTERYIAPTLLESPALDSKVMAGEIFGPILPIYTYSDETDIEKFIERYEKPLAAYVFTKRSGFAKKFIARHSFGGGTINDTIAQITNKRMPFGGVGASGIGSYHGKKTFEVFSHHKAMVKRANWMDLPMRYAPYDKYFKLAKTFKKLF